VGKFVIISFFAEGAIVVFDRFGGFAFGIISNEGDLMAIGAPLEIADVVIFFGQRKGFSALSGDKIDLGFIASVAEKRDPLAVGAPFWRGAAPFLVMGKLDGGLALMRQPYLHVIIIGFPVSGSDSISNIGTIGRQHDSAGLAYTKPFFEGYGRLARSGRCLGGGYHGLQEQGGQQKIFNHK